MKNDDLICPICGNPTDRYYGKPRKDRLCFKHGKDANFGSLIKCEKCDTWHYKDKPCNCKKPKYTVLPTSGFKTCLICGGDSEGYAFCRTCYGNNDYYYLLKLLNNAEDSDNTTVKVEEKQVPEEPSFQPFKITIDPQEKTSCITCGNITNGVLFCPSCYTKYNKKELFLKVTKCSSIEILDSSYEGKYCCKDGHICKSKSEREIDDYLYEHKIIHAYEKELSYGASAKEVLHPDFFLPNYLGTGKDVYLEHWGYGKENKAYEETKKFKLSIYEKLEITLVNTYEETDMVNIEGTLNRKLNPKFIKEGQLNL